MDPSGYGFRSFFRKIVEAVRDFFRPFTNPEPTKAEWLGEIAARTIPVFIHPRAIQQAQQGLQQASTFLVEKAGLSPAAASAVIGGVLAIPTGGWGIALAAGGAFISTEILETETAQRAVASLANGLMAVGMSERTAYTASAQIIGFGVGVGVGFGLGAAAQGIVSGLSQFEGLAGGRTEIVQRAMSRAELEATKSSGYIRGGKIGVPEDPHYVSNTVNSNALRARQRLSLRQTPEVRATLEVPRGSFSAPSEVEPAYGMSGGGMERKATGRIPVKVLGEDAY